MTADESFSPSLLADRVAFITGGARGQGRSHAIAMARAGADIVICDSVTELPTVPYELSKETDLEETRALVEAEGRRCIAEQVDVRDLAGLERLAAHAAAERHGRAFDGVGIHGSVTVRRTQAQAEEAFYESFRIVGAEQFAADSNERIRLLSTEAARSGAYLYPLKVRSFRPPVGPQMNTV